jgi:hypothetical protein
LWDKLAATAIGRTRAHGGIVEASGVREAGLLVAEARAEAIMSSFPRSEMMVPEKPWAQAARGSGGLVPPRKRRLVRILSVFVAVALAIATAVMVARELAQLRETNAGVREALAAIEKHREDFLAARTRMLVQERRIGTDPPQLAADLEAAARAAGFEIAQADPKPTVPAGRHHREHSVAVTLRQVELLSLSKFLSKLETGERVVVVTQLLVKPSHAAGNKVDVSLTAAGWERLGHTPAKLAARR